MSLAFSPIMIAGALVLEETSWRLRDVLTRLLKIAAWNTFFLSALIFGAGLLQGVSSDDHHVNDLTGNLS